MFTDCPGVHFYSGNFLQSTPGKEGVTYNEWGGMCLETHFFPDAVHHPQWRQPIVAAGVPYDSVTKFQFA